MTQLDLSFDSVFGNQPAAAPKNNIDLSFDSVFGNAPYGYRVDGTPKGEGWLGLIPMNDGRQMSELSVGVEFDGKETLIPAIVPGLSDEQIDYLKAGGDPRENREIMQMAQDHAMQRMRAGKGPFADADYEKPKPSFLDRDKERFDIGRGVMRQAQEYLDSGKPIENIDEDILSFMLSDDSRGEYVLEEKQYNDLRQALQDRQSEELGTFSGIISEVTDQLKRPARGLIETIASTPQSMGRAYETFRETAMGLVDTDTSLGQAIDIVSRQMLNEQTGKMIKGGEALDDVSRELLETELFVNKAAEINLSLTDWRTWAYTVGKGIGQMAAMIVAGATAGPAGVAIIGYGMGADQIYDGVYDVLGKAEGMPEAERDRIAREYALVGGSISAVLEMAGIEKVLGRIGKNKTTLGQYFKDIAVASMAEGLTEAAQTSLEQTLNYMADETIPMDDRVNIATKFVENMFTSETALAAGTGAIVGGGAVAVGSPVTSRIDEKKLRKKFVEPYVRDRQPEPEQIEIEGQPYIRQESTGNLIPATLENIVQEREAQRATIEEDLQTKEAEDIEDIEATGEKFVVVRDGEIVGEFDPAGSDELNESLRASGRDPDETDMQDFAFDEAERVAAVEGGEVMVESEYLRDTREQQAAERRSTLAETDPELIELTPAEQSLQVIDRAATAESKNNVQHTSRVMTTRESSPAARKIQAIGEKAGLEVVVIETQTSDGSVAEFPAVIDPNNSRRIFVSDSGSQRDMLELVFGHELFHTLEKENPDLYDALISQLPSKFRQALARYSETGLLGSDPSVSKLLSEGFAQLTQDSLLGLGTESLFDGDATKIQRFKDFVRRMMVKLGMRGKWAKDVLNVMEQIAGGVDLADIGLTKKQESRVDRLRRDAERNKPKQPRQTRQPEQTQQPPQTAVQTEGEPVAQEPTAQDPVVINYEDTKGDVGSDVEVEPKDYYPNANVGDNIHVYDIDGNRRTARVAAISDAGSMKVEFVNSAGEVVTEALVGLSAIASPINPKSSEFEIVHISGSGQLRGFEGRRIESLSDRELEFVEGLAIDHLKNLDSTAVDMSPIQIKQGLNDAGESPVLKTRALMTAVKAEIARRQETAETQAQPQPDTAPVAGVTQEDIDAEPDPTVQFAAAPPVQSPEFRRWFKNSKVVDNQGKPQVVYHGTKREFSKFESRFPELKLLFFTEDSKFASDWMDGQGGVRQASDEVISEANEMRAYERQLYDELGIRDIDPSTDAGLAAFDQIQQTIKDRMTERFGFESASRYKDVGGTRVMPVYLSVQKLFDPRKHWNSIELESNSPQYIEAAKRGTWIVYENENTIDQIKALGYDGIRLAESTLEDAPLNTIAVFDPTQIKSATANVGTYDPSNPDIQFAARRKDELEIQFAAKPPNAPNERVRSLARGYMNSVGMNYEERAGEYVEIDPVVGMQIADAFDAMQHSPTDPAVIESYNALKKETLDQYDYLIANGVQLIPWAGKGEPYPFPNGSKLMAEDVQANERLYYFKTINPEEEVSFGQGEGVQGNPLLDDVGRPVRDSVGNMHSQTYNDLFRAVHDYFGHSKEGYGFGPRGEENAWVVHSRMYSSLARRSMTTETRGQNNWVNWNKDYGQRLDGTPIVRGDEDYIPLADRPYAEQKIGLLPKEYVQFAARVERGTLPLGSKSDATPRTYRLRHISKEDRTDVGLSLEYAGSSTANRDERQRYQSDPSDRELHFYTEKAQAEYIVLTNNKVSHDVETELRILRFGSPEHASMFNKLVERRQKTNAWGIADNRRYFQELKREAIAEGYDAVENPMIGHVVVLRDVAASDIVNAQTLDSDLKNQLAQNVQFAARKQEQVSEKRLSLSNAREVIPTGGKKEKKTVTVKDAAAAIMRPRTDYKDEKQFNAAVDRAVRMVELQLDQEQSGLGWYNKDIVSAWVETSKVYPELADPKRHIEKQVFLSIAAVLSNGQQAPANWQDAAYAYGEYKKTGRIPKRREAGTLYGTRGNTIAQQFSALEHMFDVMGEANTAIWLTSQKTVDEMRSIRRGAAKDPRLADSSFKNDAMYKESRTMSIAGRKNVTKYGAYVLGEKIGPFFLNLNGIDETTIDVWAMRTFGREFGILLDNPSKETGVHDAPTGIERPYAKRFFEEIGKRLGIKEQDAQAVAWFAEKELYLAAGVKSAKTWYFSDGARKFVKSPSGQSSVRTAAPTVGAGSSIQFAARRSLTKKEKTRWLTGQVKDPELLEMQAKYRSASPIAKEAYREGRREAKAEAKEKREVYTTAAKGILEVARNRQRKLKSGFKDIEKMRRELRQLMQKVLSPKDRGRYLGMLDDVRTEAKMKAALQRIINKAAKSGWSDEVDRYRRAVRRVGRHKNIPDSVGKELEELVERGKQQSTEKVAIKSGPDTGKLTTRKKNIGGVKANVEATTDLVKTTDEILEKLLAALENKRVTKEGRGVMIGIAIDAIVEDLRAGANPLKRSIKVRGKKGDATTAQNEIKTGKFMTALLWHRQIPNIIKVITRDPNGNGVFHKLFVDDMRAAESNMELRKQQIIAELEEAAKLAGFKSLEDASVRLDASHGIGLANPLIEITLGGKKVQLLEGELLHLALMDAGTVEQIIYDNVPLKIARAGDSAIAFQNVTDQEYTEAIKKLDPKVLAYGQYLKDKINSLSSEMQQALRKLQGYDAEMIPDYYPVSRDLSETKFGSEVDMDNMLRGKTGVGQSAILFAENSGQTRSRVKNKNAIFVKPATNVFSQNIDSTLRIIYMAEPIRNADAISRDPRVKQEITSRHGTRVYKALRQYLAEASGINEHQAGGLGTFFRWMTSNLAGSYIALNPSTMLIQFSGIPRLYGRVNMLDITKGITWATANIKQLGSIMEQHGYFADRWSRSTITRFGPQQYSGLVPVNKDGFMRGVTDALVSLTRMDMKSFNKSWRSANDSIQVLDAIDKFICGVAYGANLAKAKRESPQLSEANLQERALEGAVLDIRETQNSSSRLDLSVSASDWRRSPAGEAFLLFSSDRFTLLNRLAHGKRLLQEGNKAEGARIIMGSMMSMAAEVPIRQAYWTMITAGVFALFGGEDDDRKKAERAQKAEEVWYTNIVRSFVGMSPIFGGLFETGASMFMDKMYSDAFLSSAAGDAVANIARNGKRATSEFMKLTDEEQEFAVEVAISSTVNMLSQIAALTTGNPLHPIVNKLMRGWAGNGNDPVGDLNKLDTYYSGVEELTDEQRENADEVKRENKGIKRQASRIRSQIKALRVRAAAGESIEAEMRGLQVRMAELELRSMKILGYDTEDLQEYADEKGISLEQ